jgi:glutamate synthase (NADPH) small chain
MGDPKGFMTTGREVPKRRPVDVRIKDWREVYEPQSFEHLQKQAGRCMDCGIPFCHNGCPLGNLIPEWNDLIFRGDKEEAINRLHATNNFPEFTGRLCPAPCETACVVAINREAVTIKQIELRTIEEAFDMGNVKPMQPDRLTGKTVAVIGSGPAGVDVGVELTGTDLRRKYDAVVLAVGATQWRDLKIKGRELKGVYQAMEFLPWGNKQALGEVEEPLINVAGKHVVILGGGDTGADCLGTSVRQGAASVTQLEIMPRPSDERPSSQPWPTYPMIYRVSSAHEEQDNRMFAVSTEEFLGDSDGNLRAIKIVETEFINGKFEPKTGSEKELKADFVFMAMGFTGPEKSSLINQLEVELDERGNIKRDANFQTSEEGIFVAGDAGRGQSLIVWAIAEGRSAAAAVDTYLTGGTQLPSPIEPTSKPLMV